MGNITLKKHTEYQDAFDIATNAGDAEGFTFDNGVIVAPKITKSALKKAALACAWSNIGLERDKRLHHTDTVLTTLLLPDSFPLVTATKQAKIIASLKTYRQALRDITKQADPTNITWPTPPGGI